MKCPNLDNLFEVSIVVILMGEAIILNGAKEIYKNIFLPSIDYV